MERQYYINLNCTNHVLHDSKKNSWDIKGPVDNPEQYIDLSRNTIKFLRDGCYLECNSPVNTNRFTLSFKYKIDQNFFQKANVSKTDIYALYWNNGFIKILEFKDDKQFIVININDNDIRIPENYVKYPEWNHLLLSCKNDTVQLYYNGIRKEDKEYPDITYDFNHIKLGNYVDQNKALEGPIVEYDDIVIVNDCLYTEEFDVSDYPLQMLFPEETTTDNIIDKERETLISAPVLFSSKDSLNDIIHNHEVTRHKNYIKDKSLCISKYKFN